MIERKILFLVVILGISHVSSQSIITNRSNECIINVRNKPYRKFLDNSSFISKSGYIFPPEITWTKDGNRFGCVCYSDPLCQFRYCPLTEDTFNAMHENCETGFHVKEYYKFSITTTVISNIPMFYSIDMPFRTSVEYASMMYMKNFYKRCKQFDNDLEILEKYFQQDSMKLRDQLRSRYNFNITYCECSGNSLNIYTPLCYEIDLPPESDNNKTVESSNLFHQAGTIVSIPCLLITFVVYTVLPEMRNIHGLTLRGYVGCLFMAYFASAVHRFYGAFSDQACLYFALIIYYSSVASFFWLNVISFDIWWTFGGFGSPRGSFRESGSTRFLMYSIYVWGCTTILTSTCVIMIFVPGIPDNLIRPGFDMKSNCWFETEEAKALYFYGPMGIMTICNLFFFVSTIIKIAWQKKDTERHLEGKDSRRHHDNKNWLNLYLKLFIVMGVHWSVWLISWMFKELRNYAFYITESGNEYQGLIIFIIFICKKNIKRLLVKRFGGQLPNYISRDSMTSVRQSSVWNTYTPTIPQSQ